MTFEALLESAKLFRLELKNAIVENCIAEPDDFENDDAYYRKFYEVKDGEIIYNEPIAYELIEKEYPALAIMKKYNCVIHDINKEKYRIQFLFGYNKKWLFKCYMSTHTGESNNLSTYEFYDPVNETKMENYFDFSHEQNIPDLFEMLSYPNTYEYLRHKWKFLLELSDKLKSDGYHSTNFKIRPTDKRVPEIINFDFNFEERIIHTLYSTGQANFQIIRSKENQQPLFTPITYKATSDYPNLITNLKFYLKYINNQYGYLNDGIYYNDKQIDSLIQKFNCNIKKNYYQHNPFQPRIEKITDTNGGDYFLNKIDLAKGIICDITYKIDFGKLPIRLSPKELENIPFDAYKQKDEYQRPPLDLPYESYTLHIKIHLPEYNEFTLSQYSISKTSQLKNSVTYINTYHSILNTIKESLSKIYEIYLIPPINFA